MATFAVPGNCYSSRFIIEQGLSLNLVDTNTCSEFIGREKRKKRTHDELVEKCIKILYNLPFSLIWNNSTTYKKIEPMIHGADNNTLLNILLAYENAKTYPYESLI